MNREFYTRDFRLPFDIMFTNDRWHCDEVKAMAHGYSIETSNNKMCIAIIGSTHTIRLVVNKYGSEYTIRYEAQDNISETSETFSITMKDCNEMVVNSAVEMFLSNEESE